MVRLARALPDGPRIPTCAQGFRGPCAHIINAQRQPQHRENDFCTDIPSRPCASHLFHAHNGRKDWPTFRSVPGMRTSAARHPRAHIARTVLACASERLRVRETAHATCGAHNHAAGSQSTA
eukprot:7386667-Prymnesium_polylepis.1